MNKKRLSNLVTINRSMFIVKGIFEKKLLDRYAMLINTNIEVKNYYLSY